MSRILNYLRLTTWKRIVRLRGAEEVTMEEVNTTTDIRDFMYPVQILLNGIKELTDDVGWDMGKWTMGDLAKFMDMTNRVNNKEQKINNITGRR